MEIIQQYEILGSFEAPVDIAGVSQSTLDDIDPTKIILLVSCRYLYSNDITMQNPPNLQVRHILSTLPLLLNLV